VGAQGSTLPQQPWPNPPLLLPPWWVPGTPAALDIPTLCLTLFLEIQLKGEMNFGVTARGWEASVHGGE